MLGCNPASERYERQIPLVGLEGQERISRATVAIVGLGGLGSIVSLYLAGAGVGELVLIDGDTVEPGNLNRQVLYDEASLGLPKAVLAARRVRALNSCVRTIPVQEKLSRDNAEELLGGADLVVDALDNWESRLVLDEYAEKAGVPLVHGAVEQYYGQVMLVTPGGPRLRLLAPRAPSRRGVPVLGPVVGVVASLEALLALEALLGRWEKAGVLYVVDARSMEITGIPVRG